MTIRPTKADVAIAHTVARKTSGPPEKLARALTWGADEKVLALTAIGWLSLREAPANLYGGPPATPSFWRPRLLCGPTA